MYLFMGLAETDTGRQRYESLLSTFIPLLPSLFNALATDLNSVV